MTDLSKLSDEELLRLYQGGQGSQGSQPSEGGNLANLSDADLQRLHAEDQPAYSGSLLPFSRDGRGNVSFDSDAGILGFLKGLVTGPQRAMRGEMSKDDMARWGADVALTLSPNAPGLRAGQGVAGAAITKRAKITPPSAQALREAADSQYEQARGLGVEYAPKAVSDLASGLQRRLNEEGTLANLAPQTHGILNDLANPPPGAVSAPIQNLEAARRAFGHARGAFANPAEQRAAGIAQDGLTGFLEGSVPQSVVAGPAPTAAGLYRDARANYAASRRSNLLQGIDESADLQAAAAHSGSNLDNTIRQRLRVLRDNPSRIAGFDEAERAAIDGAIRGGPGRNTARFLGNIMGGGGGLGMAAGGSIGGTIGAAVGGAPGAFVGGLAVPAAGAGLKGASNRLAQRALRGVDEMTRMRSPLAQALQAQAGPAPALSPAQEAIIRLLLAEQMQGQPQ